MAPSRWLHRIRRALRNDQLILAALAVVVGILAGGGTVLLRYAIDLVQLGALGTVSDTLAEHAASLPWWRIMLSTTLGGFFIGLLIRYALPGGRPQGIPAVIASGALQGGRMSKRIGLVSAIASAASMGVGASVGREGPAVHLGATLGSWIADKMRLTRPLTRTLLGCGAAAAVSASFNAPIAGALFAHEVVVGHFALSAFAPIVISSVVGTVISRAVFGDTPAFHIDHQVLASVLEFPAIAGLGVLAGIVAIVFIRATFIVEDISARLPDFPGLRTAIGGFLVGLIGVAFPHVLGVGYDATDMALSQELSLTLLIAILLAKIAASALSLGTGFSGGVFSPTLMIGAMLGGAYGIVATGFFPDYSAGPGAYTVIGMGAVAAAVLGAPISTVLIVFEMTDNYALTVGVMFAVVISCMIGQHFVGKSFFNLQLARAGHDYASDFEDAFIKTLRVETAMRTPEATVRAEAGLDEVRALLLSAPNAALFVIDAEGALRGLIRPRDLLALRPDDSVTAGTAAREDVPHVLVSDDLGVAQDIMRANATDIVAVISDSSTRKLAGIVTETDVLKAHNRALHDVRREERDGVA